MVTERDAYLALADGALGSTFYPPSPGRVAATFEGRDFWTGLYLMWGPSSGGKSTNSLALALELGLPSGELNYLYVMEPRAQGEWSDRLRNASLAFEAIREAFSQYRQTSGREASYLCIDSLTYVIPAVGMTQLGGQDDVTMSGGLRRSDVLGVLSLDTLAREQNLCVVATVNSELFPRPHVLEGACEGIVEINEIGHLTVKDRAARVRTTLNLSDSAVSAARVLLGQGTRSDPNFVYSSEI